MSSPSGSYARRFTTWEFWIALAAVVFDVISFVVPIFALAFVVILLQPQGWRSMARITDVLRRIQQE
jgi:hypothetical protein